MSITIISTATKQDDHHPLVGKNYYTTGTSTTKNTRRNTHTNSYWNSMKNAVTSLNDSTIHISITSLTSVVYFCLLISFTDVYLIPKYSSTTMTDYIIINLYLASAFQVTFLNTIYHIFKSHSIAKAFQWGNINKLGVLNYLTVSTISLLYYGFYDNVFYFKLLTIVTFLLNLLMVVAVNLNEINHTNKNFLIRVLFVVFTMALITLPLSLSYLKFGKQKIMERVDLNLLILEIGCYLVAGFVYSSRIVEHIGIAKLNSRTVLYSILIVASFIHLKILLNSFVLMRIGLNKPTLINFQQ